MSLIRAIRSRHARSTWADALRRWRALPALALGALLLAAGCASVPTDPLPSWNQGQTKQSILDFVGKVTTPGSPDFVPAPERIATFDNDGTMWSEQPLYFQVVFALDRIKELAPAHPEWM